MPTLTLDDSFPFPGMVREVADGDTMYDGRDGHYVSVGLDALRCIRAALDGRAPRSILDMPSGFGRVTRMLRAQYPAAAITVCDLDRAGVDFASAQFAARPVYSVEAFETLEFGQRFDLIWVGSLVTHLSEAQTRAFLAAMARHMHIGGTLVASTHGPTITPGLRDWGYGLEPAAVAGLLDDYRDCGYGHRGYGGSAGYGISLTDRLWWQTALAQGPLRLARYQTQAWDGHQDVVVLRKRRGFARLWPRKHVPSGPALAARIAAAAYDGCMADFDPAFYVAANPDVALSIAAGHHASAFQHYWRKGRFEHRRPNGGRLRPTPLPAGCRFDEAWYLARFPDVAAAVARDEVASGYDHWVAMGQAEGRPGWAPANGGGDAGRLG